MKDKNFNYRAVYGLTIKELADVFGTYPVKICRDHHAGNLRAYQIDWHGIYGLNLLHIKRLTGLSPEAILDHHREGILAQTIELYRIKAEK